VRLLIDTQILLWWVRGGTESQLKKTHMAQLLDTDNELYFSHVSIWEMAIKQAIGKLKLPTSAEEFARFETADKSLILLPIKLEHIGTYEKLPMTHRDPFDRMLAAQSKAEGIKLMTSDKHFDKLGVKRYW
jgi:PIN domain nuclease of toxin-antitoxin system